MNKNISVIAGLTVVLLLGAVAVAALSSGGSNDAAANATPSGFVLVKSRFAVPGEMGASARGGEVFAPESVPGYAILIFGWKRSNGSSKGSCVSVDSGNPYEVGPYCFATRQLTACNALISLRRPAGGDYVTFGLVRESVGAVTVRQANRTKKQIPATDGKFVTLSPERVDSCSL